MNRPTTWAEDYQVLCQNIQDSLENESGSAAKLSGQMVLLTMITGLNPIFAKCQQKTVQETTEIAADYVRKFIDEERTKLEAEGLCPTCKQPVGK